MVLFNHIIYNLNDRGVHVSERSTLPVHDVKDWRIHSMLIDGNDPRGWRIRRAQGSMENLGSCTGIANRAEQETIMTPVESTVW